MGLAARLPAAIASAVGIVAIGAPFGVFVAGDLIARAKMPLPMVAILSATIAQLTKSLDCHGPFEQGKIDSPVAKWFEA
jgi:hypothetical protein